MKPTQALHEAGQSLWLDNITRALLDKGILARYVAEYSVTGLTSNPTIFDRAIKDGTAYDADIAARKADGATDEQVFFDLALADLRRAADLLAPVHARTDGVDGWVSLEVSPLLAHDTPRTVDQAESLHREAALGNLFIKIPGTAEGLPAIEECIYAGVPVNVTLLFSAEQYRAAAEAYLRGVQRRIRAELDPAVGSVASTSVKDPRARDVLYVEALAAPFTVNTMPDQTLEAFADHGTVGEFLPADGGDADQVIAAFAQAGIDTAALAAELQRQGAEAFAASWQDLLARIGARYEQLARTS